MASIEKVSSLVKNQFPDFYKEEGENFIAFIEAYYAWMEETGQMTHAIQNLESYRDVSTTTDDFIQYFANDLLPSVPNDVIGDKKIMAKYIKYFNRSRGTLASYRLLFRALYNEDIDVYYPSNQIIKLSDGDWTIDRYLVTPYDPKTYSFIQKTIKGTNSNAEALVEDIITRTIRGRHIMQIILSNIKGTFSHLEPISLLSDLEQQGHQPIVEAGIDRIDVLTPGGKYQVGDVVNVLSQDTGKFSKIVVTETIDLGNIITFEIVEGGSGYTPSTDEYGTELKVYGGDGTSPAGFTIETTDITDTFRIQINTNIIGANNVFGNNGPYVAEANGHLLKASTFANTIIGQVNLGFPEYGESVGNRDYRDHANAMLVIANTTNPGIAVGDSLYAVYANNFPTGANATVNYIKRPYNTADIMLDVGSYRGWQNGWKVNLGTPTGATVGTVSSFSGNTVGHVPLQVAVIDGVTLSVGDEIIGGYSNACGVVVHVGAANTDAYTAPSSAVRDVITYIVSANSSANLTSQFETGPMFRFDHYEPIIIKSSNTVVGNVVDYSTTTNTSIESIHTRLSDSLIFKIGYYGTIAKLSNVRGGDGYSIAPKVLVRENDIASLGIGEQYMTLQSSDPALLLIDETDRLVQSSTKAFGNIKTIQSKITHASNATYEATVRVWQEFGQREPGNVYFANNTTAMLQKVAGDYVPGLDADTRELDSEFAVKIVNIDDKGVLGKNAIIKPTVGSDGAITKIRVIDSGFSYKQNELVTFEMPNDPYAASGTGRVHLIGVANSEGYYATTRSQISTARGYIQDGNYYQEFSYEIISPVSLKKYRDVALKLVHPAGQILFSKYRTQSNVYLNVTSNTSFSKTLVSNGTVSITKTKASGTIAISGSGNTHVIGTSTDFMNEFGYRPTVGSVSVFVGNNTVSGNGTAFTNYKTDDLLIVGNNQYVIRKVANDSIMYVRRPPHQKNAEANSDYTVNQRGSFIVEVDTGDNVDNVFIDVSFSPNTATNVVLTDPWVYGAISSANIYYSNSHTITGSSTTFTHEFSNGSYFIVETDHKVYEKLLLNKVNSDTSANLFSMWTKADISGANAYYITGLF